jgi:predicted ATPase
VRLRDLASAERLFQLAHPSLRREFPALRSLESVPNNLPAQFTSFVGRERDMASVRRLLGTVRLLTLLGPGGIGKTRLSLQSAAEALDDFPGGAWLIELAPLSDATRVSHMVAQVLGVREEAGTPLVRSIAAQIGAQALLLVMDNCEHVAGACAQLIETLLRHAPGVSVLASSREPLRIAGEHTFPVAPLALPGAAPKSGDAMLSSPAVQLFVDRARQQQPGFAPGARNVPAIVEICRRLDGIPLALELAAARVRALPVDAIARRLDDRFRLLTGGSRTALPRQQTLRALIDWSYDLLNHGERTVFARLAVFAGGWTLEAAEAVCAADPIAEGDVLDVLAGLVDKSLVICDADACPARYGMLETIRAYAQDKLLDSAEQDAVAERHLGFYLDLADQAREQLKGTTFAQGIDAIERERENLLAAQAWCTRDEKHASRGLRLAFDLQGYWDQRAQYGAGLRMAMLALGQPGAAAPTLARAQALVAASLLAYRTGCYDEARRHAEESVSILRARGPSTLLADALIRLAHPLIALGDVAPAQRLLEERLALVRALGDERRVASTINALAEIHRLNGRVDLAAPLYEEALAMARKACDFPTLAVCELNVAFVSVLCGEPMRAARLLREALGLVGELDFRRVAGIALDVAFAIAVARGEYDWAAHVLGASEAQSALAGHTRDPADAGSIASFSERTRIALGERAFDAAYTAGRALSHDEALGVTRTWLTTLAGDDAT